MIKSTQKTTCILVGKKTHNNCLELGQSILITCIMCVPSYVFLSFRSAMNKILLTTENRIWKLNQQWIQQTTIMFFLEEFFFARFISLLILLFSTIFKKPLSLFVGFIVELFYIQHYFIGYSRWDTYTKMFPNIEISKTFWKEFEIIFLFVLRNSIFCLLKHFLYPPARHKIESSFNTQVSNLKTTTTWVVWDFLFKGILLPLCPLYYLLKVSFKWKRNCSMYSKILHKLSFNWVWPFILKWYKFYLICA